MLYPVAGVVNLSAFRYGGAMRYLLLLLLAGCASSAPRQYAQGIPTAPRPPAFNPAWDAPHTTGQPGYVGPAENIPRSPHTRTLPQTPDTRREPGLWAGDEPYAAQRPPWSDAPTTVRGVDLILLPDFKDEIYKDRVKRCAYMVEGISTLSTVGALLERLSGDELRCAIARLNAYCAQEDQDYLARALARGESFSRRFREAIRRNLSASSKFADIMCVGVDRENIDPAVGHATGQWPMFERSANVRH